MRMAWWRTPTHVKTVAVAAAALFGACAGLTFLSTKSPVRYAFSGLAAVSLAVALAGALGEVRAKARDDRRVEEKDAEPLKVDIGDVRPIRDSGAPATLAFTLTNDGSERVKLVSLQVIVARRRLQSAAHQMRPEAVPTTFTAWVRVVQGQDVYELLEADHVLVPGETEAYDVAIEAPGGWKYDFGLRARWSRVGEQRQVSDLGGFSLAFPIMNADDLDALLDNGAEEM
jgi:hypothetical protein